MITASMLYDLVQCPHRVSMDSFGDPTQRDAVSPFVQLLWERGHLFEKQVISALEEPFLDLSLYAGDEKERLTLAAMQRGEPLIYGGRIQHGDLLGDPDLLRREGDGYVAGDIKSGAGEEGGGEGEDSKPKKHYAVQLGLYTEVLEHLGRSAGRHAFIWDIHGKDVPYDFAAAYGTRNPRTLWQDYQEVLSEARAICNSTVKTLPAYSSGICKNCVWYSACIKNLESTNDLTLIPEVGRSKREALASQFATITDLARANPTEFVSGKKTVFPGIGPESLIKFHNRARLLVAPKPSPYLREKVSLPRTQQELFFDIEVDPMRDICYLHGFVTRDGGNKATEKFVGFFAETPTQADEERAFAAAWDYMRSAPEATIYFYSKYERTIYRKLRGKYPHVCSESDLEALFTPPRSVDLYFDVVLKSSEWPTRDFSIKTLAQYLGFTWRDAHPSGAASIEWFHRWVETGDLKVKQRILDYNEDDCRATRVLLDALRIMPVGFPT